MERRFAKGMQITLLFFMLQTLSLFGHTFETVGGRYYNLFGERINAGTSLMILSENYGGTGESFLWKDSVLQSRNQLDFVIERGFVTHTITAGFGLLDTYTPLTLNKFYDGVRWVTTSDAVNFNLYFTRETANEHTADVYSIVSNRENSFGLNLMGRIPFGRVGVTYLSTLISDGSELNTPLGVLGSSKEVAGLPELQFYVRFTAVGSAAGMKDISVTVNGVEYKIEDTYEQVYLSGNSEVNNWGGPDAAVYSGGYLVFKIDLTNVTTASDITSLHMTNYNGDTSKTEISLGYKYDSTKFLKVHEIGDAGGDITVKYTASASDLATLQSYVPDMAGDFLMGQVVSLFWDMSFMLEEMFETRLSVTGEYAMNIDTYGFYKDGPGNVMTNIVSEAYFLRAELLTLNNRMKVFFEGHHVDEEYVNDTFRMDDDDRDERPDSFTRNTYALPEGEYTHDTVIPGGDINLNNIVDWNEPFLDLFQESLYLTIDEDKNNNFLPDRLENDEEGDMPYRKRTAGSVIGVRFALPKIIPGGVEVLYRSVIQLSNESSFTLSSNTSFFGSDLFHMHDFASNDTEKVFMIHAKAQKTFGKRYTLSIRNRMKYIVLDTIADDAIGLLDGADNNGDGYIDEPGEIASNFTDGNGISNTLQNSFYLGGTLKVFPGLIASHTLRHEARMANGTNHTGLAGMLGVSYTFRIPFIDDLTLMAIGRLEGFRYDAGVDSVLIAREGVRRTAAIMLRYALAPGTDVNAGIERTYYFDAPSFIEYSRTSAKLEFTSLASGRYFVNGGLLLSALTYTAPYEDNSESYVGAYFEVKNN